MNKVLSLIIVIFSIQTSFAQMADATYDFNMLSYRMCDGGCGGEWFDEEGTIYVYARDNVNATENTTGCLQFNADNCFERRNINSGNGVTIGTRTNASSIVYLRSYGWEDDNSPRCSENGGDDCDCKNGGNVTVNFRQGALPSNTFNAESGWIWCSGSSGQAYTYRYRWNYTGTTSLITPTCSVQNSTQTSGDIRSHSVNLTAGVTYQFETTSGTDPYLTLYGTNGFTIVAQDDDAGTGLNSLFLYTPPTTGTYYIETSEVSVSGALAVNTNL